MGIDPKRSFDEKPFPLTRTLLTHKPARRMLQFHLYHFSIPTSVYT